MNNPSPDRATFVFETDPETAEKIIEMGFENSGVPTHEGAVTLSDRPWDGSVRVILRVALSPEAAATALQNEFIFRTGQPRLFRVPVELLRNAHVTRVDEPGLPERHHRR